MNFKSILESRYACKKFSGESIPEDKINELKEMIRLAPTSFGIMPFKIKVVTDKVTKEQLLQHSWNQVQVTTCSHLLIFCADENIEDYILKYGKLMEEKGTGKEKINAYQNIMRGFIKDMPKEDIINWVKKQIYIALSIAMNGSKALGFDSCPMEGFIPKKYEEVLNLPSNLHATVVLPVGIAADTPRPKLRYKAEEIFI